MPALPPTNLLFREGQELDARNGHQEIAWRLADALRVREVTRVVIGNAQRERMPPRPCRREGGDHLGDVARARAENPRAFAAQCGSSASNARYPFIDDPHPAAFTVNLIDAGAIEHFDRPARICARFVPAADKRGERAQQPWLAGAITSQPSAASTLTVA